MQATKAPQTIRDGSKKPVMRPPLLRPMAVLGVVFVFATALFAASVSFGAPADAACTGYGGYYGHSTVSNSQGTEKVRVGFEGTCDQLTDYYGRIQDGNAAGCLRMVLTDHFYDGSLGHITYCDQNNWSNYYFNDDNTYSWLALCNADTSVCPTGSYYSVGY